MRFLRAPVVILLVTTVAGVALGTWTVRRSFLTTGMVFEGLGAGIPALVYIGTAAIGVALLSGSGKASALESSPGVP